MYHLYYFILLYICQGMQLGNENAMLGGGTGCTTIPTAVWHSSVHTLISLACTCGWHRIEKNDPKWSKMPQFLFECQDWWPEWIRMGRCRKGKQDTHGDMHEKHRSIHPRRHAEQDERPIFRHFPDCERGLCLVAEGIVEPTLESSVPSMGFQQFPSAKSTGNIWEHLGTGRVPGRSHSARRWYPKWSGSDSRLARQLD